MLPGGPSRALGHFTLYLVFGEWLIHHHVDPVEHQAYSEAGHHPNRPEVTAPGDEPDEHHEEGDNDSTEDIVQESSTLVKPLDGLLASRIVGHDATVERKL